MNDGKRLAVKIHCLTVKIRGRRILDCINLNIPYNTIFAIMGPSGSGKSTLLRVINRLIDLIPDVNIDGHVTVLGREIFNEDPYIMRRDIGIVFQTPNPFPHLNIYDNVALGAKINGIAKNKKELNKIVEWALKKAMLWEEVKDRLNDYPSKLSGGQKQRLCLSRAIATKPKILLLDEPTANIDPANTRKIEESLVSLKKEMTIILVSHSKEQVMRISDYIAFLYMGKIVGVGRKNHIASENKLIETFLETQK